MKARVLVFRNVTKSSIPFFTTSNRLSSLGVFFIGLFLMMSCSSDDDGGIVLSKEKQLTAFQFTVANNPSLGADVTAIIHEDAKTITAELPVGSSLTALKPTITISANATVSPATEVVQDFTNAVNYTVTAQDGSKQVYAVTITVKLTNHEILVALFNANPENTLGWDLADDTMDSWNGVTHENGVVKVLNIDDINISVIPKTIGGLENLIELFLSNNSLTSIPTEIGNLTNLTELSLSGNSLTSIPTEIGNLTNLIALDLYNNSLTSIPTEIGNLTNLIVLYLDSNSLTSIPSEIGNLTNLTDLSLVSNSLTSISSKIGNLTSLTKLYLSNNSLTSIPSEIGNLTNLTYLSLHSNSLTSIPAEIGNLTNLTVLYLRSNSFTGTIPQAVCDLRPDTKVDVEAAYDCL